MIRVAALMPCRGRYEETLASIPRLQRMAGADFEMICIVDDDAPLLARLDTLHNVTVVESRERGYWHALIAGSRLTGAPLLVNLANDLLPGKDWLARGLAIFDKHYRDGRGMVGFNDGFHGPNLAPHFLISRALLTEWYGAQLWPTHYRHNFGDAEICQRAQEQGAYLKAPWATLYHNHRYLGAPDDAVYQEGWRVTPEDLREYEWRASHDWQAKNV